MEAAPHAINSPCYVILPATHLIFPFPPLHALLCHTHACTRVVSRVGEAAIISKGAATIHVEYGAPFDPFLVCLVAAGELDALGVVRNSFMVSELDLGTGG